MTVEVREVPADAGTLRAMVSPAELAYCLGFARAAEHLAARVAAKHAVASLLRWTGPVPWQEVEIVRTPQRPPEVRLTGSVERWCQQANLPVPRVSLSHAGGYAAALAWLPEAAA